MKAVTFQALHTPLAFESLPEPKPDASQVVVKVGRCGICGSDRHMFLGEFPTAVPVIQGHEFSGIVVARGPDASRVPIGARITGGGSSWLPSISLPSRLLKYANSE